MLADEVRKLAERTTGATGDISRMIHGVRTESGQVVGQMRVVVSDVNGNVAKVEQAGAVLKEIRSQSEHSLEIVADIASATQEQSLAGHLRNSWKRWRRWPRKAPRTLRRTAWRRPNWVRW